MPYYQFMELWILDLLKDINYFWKKQDEGKCIQKYYLNPRYNNIYINIIGDWINRVGQKWRKENKTKFSEKSLFLLE